MSDYLILATGDGETVMLTTDSPAGVYGVPVLQITTEDVDGDFGPRDIIGDVNRPSEMMRAADVVAAWVAKPGRTADEIEVARLFLAQWPEGPQVAV
jgi:hypothetical protein